MQKRQNTCTDTEERPTKRQRKEESYIVKHLHVLYQDRVAVTFRQLTICNIKQLKDIIMVGLGIPNNSESNVILSIGPVINNIFENRNPSVVSLKQLFKNQNVVDSICIMVDSNFT